MSPKATNTTTNVREAFAREAQAVVRSLYFARRADIEGRAEAAALLRAIADGEAGHGFGHLEFLEDAADPLAGGGDTRANLASAIAEAEGNAEAYRGYAAAAREEEAADIADWFDSVAAAELAHVVDLRALARRLDAAT